MELTCPHCRIRQNYRPVELAGRWALCPSCGDPFRWLLVPELTEETESEPTPETGADLQPRDSGATEITRLGVAFRRALTAIALITAPLSAQTVSAPNPLVITAENLMADDAQHAAIAAHGGSATALLPGDVVRYRLSFTNITSNRLSGVVFKNPIPAGLRYVSGSAGADRVDVTVAYSIDGGKTFAAQPMIEVEENGKRVKRPAAPEMYTHVRWTVPGAVLPGAQVRAEFRATLIAAPTTGTITRSDSGR